jgi:hypothetical protein
MVTGSVRITFSYSHKDEEMEWKSLRCHDDVILFAFAQQEVLAEKQIAGRHRALEV